jgi:hypothetical protein
MDDSFGPYPDLIHLWQTKQLLNIGQNNNKHDIHYDNEATSNLEKT